MEDWICRVLDGRHSNVSQNLKIYALYQCSGFHDGNYSSDLVVFYKPFNVKTIKLEFEIHILTVFVKPSAKDVSCTYIFNVGGS
jgi:hypothetical protein